MKLYKITDGRGRTLNHTQWGDGITHEAADLLSNPELCTGTVIHAYRSLNLALLIYRFHVSYSEIKLWEAEGEVVVEDPTKVGCIRLTTVMQIDPASWFRDEQARKKIYVRFAILCAEAVLHLYEAKYPKDQRPRKAIKAATEYLDGNAAYAADAAYSAHAAATRAAATRAAAYAAYAAAYAAYAAAYAADAAAYAAADAAAAAAADAAACADKKIDLTALADQAVNMHWIEP